MLMSALIIVSGCTMMVDTYGEKYKERSLRDFFSFERLIPSSPNVQHETMYAQHSPWKEQVIDLKVTNKEQITNTKSINQEFVVDEETTNDELGMGATKKKETFTNDDIRLIVNYIHRYWSPYVGVGVVTGVALMSLASYQLLFAYTLKAVIDNALIIGGSTLIKNALIKLAIALPAAFGLMLSGEWLGARLSSRIASDIRYDLFVHLQSLPSTFHKEARLGDLLTHFSTDMEKIELAMGKELTAAVGDVIMLLVNLGVMIYLSLPLALISLTPLILMRRPVVRATENFFETGYAMHQQKGLMTNAAQEGIRAHSLSQSFAIDDFIRRCFGNELNKLEDKNSDALFGRGLFIHTAGFSYNLVRLTTLSGGVLLVFSGAMTSGGLLAAMTVTESFFFNYAQLANQRVTQWVEAGVGLRRLDKVFKLQPTIMDAPHAFTLSPFGCALRFEAVTFSYNGQEKANNGKEIDDHNGGQPGAQLSNIDLTIEAGQFVAFVGPSGAGKSTIFNLLMRFYDVGSGRITIDNHDVRDVTLASLRTQIGVVLQDTFLFNTTIENNICIVKPNATKREMIAATQAAELHEFIMSLPDGYQTIVGENGGRLSGGQRQRIAIARALLVNPAILLLDEATSSLDVDTAAKVNTTIQRIAKDRTVIMISHYLPAVTHVDTIFVLKDGHLVEQGNHEALLEQEGVYHQLWLTQNHLSP